MRQVKPRKKRHTEVPGNRARAARPNDEEPTELDHQPSGTTVPRVGVAGSAWLMFLGPSVFWHGVVVPRGTTVPPSFRNAT